MFINYFYSVFSYNIADINLQEVTIQINTNLSNIVLSENDVFLLLKRFDNNKGNGSKGLPLSVLRGCAANDGATSF